MRNFFRILGTVLILIALVFAIFNAKFSVTHFEDGGGVVSISYCVPFEICNVGD